MTRTAKARSPHPTRRRSKAPSSRAVASHEAGRPQRLTLRDGRQVTLRAVRPQDAAEIVQAFNRLSPRSRYQRFMQHKKELDPMTLDRGVNPIAGREFALVATVPAADGYDIVGGARYVAADESGHCEFSITVADDWCGCGLAQWLMRSLIRQAAADGYRAIDGIVLPENEPMLSLARSLRFEITEWSKDPAVMLVSRALPGPSLTAARRRTPAGRPLPATTQQTGRNAPVSEDRAENRNGRAQAAPLRRAERSSNRKR